MKKLRIFSDGCSRGNPGPAGIGYVLYDEDGAVLCEVSKPVGARTSNEAEYIALIEALREAIRLGADEVECYSDSELLVRQLRGEYAVRSPRLRTLYRKLISMVSEFRSFKITHIGRGVNRRADELARRAVNRSSPL